MTTEFPFDFAVASASELAVLIDEVEVDPGAYTVEPNDPDDTVHGGGTIVFASAPTGSELMIVSVPAFTQEIGFQNAGPFLPESHDIANDRGAIRDIWLKGQVERSMRLPLGANPLNYVGLYPTLDAEGNVVFSQGTGADAALRSDLAGSGGSALAGFIRPDVGATSRSVQSKLRDVVHAKDFGLAGDGTDEATKLIAFVNSARANPGIFHEMEAKTYRTSQPLPDLNVSNIRIRGQGCETRASLAGELSGTWIKYIGAATASSLLTITSVSGASNRRVANVEFSGIGLDANGLMDHALRMLSIYDCDVVTAPINATVTAVECDDVATLAESRTSQRNRIRLTLRQVDANAAGNGIVLTGDLTTNWSMNEFWIDAIHEDAPVVIAENVDNNTWHFFRAFQIPGGTATEAVSLLGGPDEPRSARAERFLFYTATLPIHAYGTEGGTYAYPSTNSFVHLDSDNGTPVPVVGTGASVHYRKNNTPTEETGWIDYVPVVSTTSGTVTTYNNVGGSYRKIGKRVDVKIKFGITTNGTGAGGFLASLPVASAGAVGHVGVGKETALNNKMVSAFIGGAGATTMTIHNADGTYPGANATNFTILASYEAA